MGEEQGKPFVNFIHQTNFKSSGSKRACAASQRSGLRV